MQAILVFLAVAQGPAVEFDAKPPWQRLLQGDAAKQAAELEKRLARDEEAGRFADAAATARQLLEIRVRAQAKEHWQAVDCRWRLRVLERLAGLPAENQKQWLAAQKALREAGELAQQGRPARAKPLYERGLAVLRQTLGDDHPRTADGCNDLAYCLGALGKYAEARPLYEKSLAIRTKALGESHPDTANACNNLAMNLNARGKYSEAQPLFEKALALYRSVLGEDDLDTATGYRNLATNLDDLGKPAEAQPLHEKALAIKRKSLREDDPDIAVSYGNLATNLDLQAKYVQAQTLYEKALAINRKALGEEDTATALSYDNLAVNLDRQGKYAEGRPLYEKALAIRKKALGENHPDTARSYNNLAVNVGTQGQFAEAQPLHERALAIRRQVLGDDHPDTAFSYENLARNLGARARFAEAQPLQERALAIRRKALGEDHPDTTRSYEYLAGNLGAQGKYAEAVPLHERALAASRKALGDNHPATARCCDSLALDLHGLGRYDQAQPLYERALAIRRQALGERHPLTAESYNSLAGNLDSQGRFVEAQPLHEKAVILCLESLGVHHPSTARLTGRLAANLRAQGKYTEALVAWEKAADCFNAARLQFGLGGLDRADRAAQVSPLGGLAAALARAGKPEQAWRRLEENLGRGLFDDLSARQARRLSPDDRTHQKELFTRLERFDKLFDRPKAGPEDGAARQERLAELSRQRSAVQAECSALEAELTRRYGVTVGEVYGLAAVQKQLPADTALLAWLDRPGDPHAADPNGEHWACVVRHTGAPIWVRLRGTGHHGAWTEDDERLADQVGSACAVAPTDGGSWKGLAGRLARQRLDPVATVLAGRNDLPAVRRLVVLPSPRLAGVPVEVLTVPGDGFTVSYAPSGTVLAWLLARHPQSEPSAPGRPPSLLALADPVFASGAPVAGAVPEHGVFVAEVPPGSLAARAGLRPGDVLLRYGDSKLTTPADLGAAVQKVAAGNTEVAVHLWRDGKEFDQAVPAGRLGIVPARSPAPQALREDREFAALLRSVRAGDFRPLPGTRREVEAIIRTFRAADAAAPVTLLQGPDASEQRLNGLLTGDRPAPFRFVHLATHGLADNRLALRSALVLSQDRLPDPVEQALHERPVYDGRLTAAAVLRDWNLDADLVVLSACQSGLGKRAGGEGFVGFAQALLLAGARSVVVSLWKVDDTATALLMQRFYENLLGKRAGLEKPLSKAEALREAKEWLRNLDAKDVDMEVARLPQVRGAERPKAPATAATKPFEHPYYWSAFILVGDPQ